MADFAAPILPSSDLDRTQAFYASLGFALVVRIDAPGQPYMILQRGPIWLHFFGHEIDPAESDFMAYLHLENADAWADEFRSLGLPSEGAPRFGDIADMTWGMREFHVVDPDGTLIRAGQEIPEDANG